MKILVVAATEQEVTGLRSEALSPKSVTNESGDSELRTFDFELLITGVGMAATAFALGRHLALHPCDLAINVGIAGCFDRSAALGELFEVRQDTFAELGAEDDTSFLPITQMGFGEDTFYPSKKLTDLYNLFNTFNLKQADAITVNTVHGNEESIRKVTQRLNPQLESMEGAAFFYACKQMNVPCLQIRAVSNYVEKRDRDNWNIPLAIKNLNTFAVEFLKLYA
ncbi:MAG TPA: futalosine hydrolase [Mucilaginibacter sp.]|nr:futalosine hydrolase [Mucilaginibacter sp.]